MEHKTEGLLFAVPRCDCEGKLVPLCVDRQLCKSICRIIALGLVQTATALRLKRRKIINELQGKQLLILGD